MASSTGWAWRADVALVLADAFVRDDDGYNTSDTEPLSIPPTRAQWRTSILEATRSTLSEGCARAGPHQGRAPGGGPIFVGIGSEREVDAYLRGVGHAEVEDLSDDPPRYLTRLDGAPQGPPSAQFWVAFAEGSGRQAVPCRSRVEAGRSWP